jgi:hypothetical protein
MTGTWGSPPDTQGHRSLPSVVVHAVEVLSSRKAVSLAAEVIPDAAACGGFCGTSFTSDASFWPMRFGVAIFPQGLVWALAATFAFVAGSFGDPILRGLAIGLAIVAAIPLLLGSLCLVHANVRVAVVYGNAIATMRPWSLRRIGADDVSIVGCDPLKDVTEVTQRSMKVRVGERMWRVFLPIRGPQGSKVRPTTS